MTDAELSALETTARAATSGPWCIPGREDLVVSEKGAEVAFCAVVFSSDPNCTVRAEQAEKNAAYIAAANPAAILELIAELRQARKERDWLAKDIAKSARENHWLNICYTPEYWIKAAKEATCQK